MFKLINYEVRNKISPMADGYSQITINRLTRLNQVLRLPVSKGGMCAVKAIAELEQATTCFFGFDVVCTGANRSTLMAFDVKDGLVSALRIYSARFGRHLQAKYNGDTLITSITFDDENDPTSREHIVNNVNYLIELNLNQFSFNSFFSHIVPVINAAERNSAVIGAPTVCWDELACKQQSIEPHSAEFYAWLQRLAEQE